MKDDKTDLKAIAKKYMNCKDLRRFSGYGNHALHASIRTKRDVEIHYNGACNIAEEFSKSFDLVQDDMNTLKKFIGDYEVAVNKAIQMIADTNTEWDDFYTAEELQKLIDNVFALHDKYDKIRFRRLNQ